MDTKKKIELTAPCGLDCFNCEVYEENVTEEFAAKLAKAFGKKPEEVPCAGCRENDGCMLHDTPCKTRACVAGRGIDYCYECTDFPCLKLAPARDMAERLPHNYKIYNLSRIRAIGIGRWADEESEDIRKRYYKGVMVPGAGPTLPEEGRE